jgi:hypothetical protein
VAVPLTSALAATAAPPSSDAESDSPSTSATVPPSTAAPAPVRYAAADRADRAVDGILRRGRLVLGADEVEPSVSDFATSLLGSLAGTWGVAVVPAANGVQPDVVVSASRLGANDLPLAQLDQTVIVLHPTVADKGFVDALARFVATSVRATCPSPAGSASAADAAASCYGQAYSDAFGQSPPPLDALAPVLARS